MARKKSPRRKRYTPEQKKNILETAAKEGLTGAQVAKRFGVSTLTFYRWRGPVRGPRARATDGPKKLVLADGALRDEVRARIAKVLPEIIHQEVAQALSAILGKRRPGRPRRTAV